MGHKNKLKFHVETGIFICKKNASKECKSTKLKHKITSEF